MVQGSQKKPAADQPERLAAEEKLAQFLTEHHENATSYPWKLGELLFAVNGSSTETQFGAWQEKFLQNHRRVRLPKSTAWDHLDRHRQALAVFSVGIKPEPVIEAMLAEGIPPSKQTVIDGARNSSAIVQELETIRAAANQGHNQFVPGLCSAVVTRIKEAAKRKAAAPLSAELRNADSLCRRFKLLIAETDPQFPELYPKGRTEAPKDEDVAQAKRALYHGCLIAFQRCGLFPKSEVSADSAVRELQNAWLESQKEIERMIAETIEERQV